MIAQIIIAITGFLAIWLTNDKDENRRKWAPLIGLIGQPFWLIETWNSGQIGMFVLTVAYTFAWLRGFRQYWMDGRGIRFSPKPSEIEVLAANIPDKGVTPAETPLMRKLRRKQGI